MVGNRTARATKATALPPEPAVREQILIAATRAFAAKGLDATTIQDVADAVGIRKPSLLWHFRSKEELHRAVLDALLSRWNETLPRLMRAATREDRFDAVLDETIAFFAADPDRARLLLREALDRPDAMRALLATSAAPWMSVVTDAIERGRAAGAIRSDVDADAYVVMVIHLVIGNVATAGTVLPPGLTSRSRGSMVATGGAKGSSKVPARIVREIKRVARAALMVE